VKVLNLIREHVKPRLLPGGPGKAGLEAELGEKSLGVWNLIPYLGKKGGRCAVFFYDNPVKAGAQACEKGLGGIKIEGLRLGEEAEFDVEFIEFPGFNRVEPLVAEGGGIGVLLHRFPKGGDGQDGADAAPEEPLAGQGYKGGLLAFQGWVAKEGLFVRHAPGDLEGFGQGPARQFEKGHALVAIKGGVGCHVYLLGIR